MTKSLLHKDRIMWTSEQPTEPGWYWWQDDTSTPKVMEVLLLGEQFGALGLYTRTPSRGLYSLKDWDGGEWWTEAITVPRRQKS